MAGDLPSPFQGLNPILPPRAVTALSREQFLYSLARTPSPARFQRPRSNRQILPELTPEGPAVRDNTLPSEQFLCGLSRVPSPARFRQSRYNRQTHPDLNNPFQTGEIRDSTTIYPRDAASPHNATSPHDATSPYGLNIEDKISEPPGQTSLAQIDENSDEDWYIYESNKRRNLEQNKAVANIQGSAPEVESKSALRAAQIPTPNSERKTHEVSTKKAVGIIASEIYSIAPSPPRLMNSVASVEREECNTPINLGDESGYDSDDSSGEESGSRYTDTNIPLGDSSESVRAAAQSAGVNTLDLNPHMQKYPPSHQDESSEVDQSVSATEADRISLGSSNKKLKLPTRSSLEILPQDDALQAIQGGIAENAVPGQICCTFDQLQLTEEKSVQEINSEFGDGLSDDGSSVMESQLIAPETPLLSIRQKRFPESSPQRPHKKPKKTYLNTKMVSSRIHFKDLRLIDRVSVPPICPKPIPTRLDFCDGFVGEESQPIGRKKATSRPRRLSRPGMLRLTKGYACQLPLVQSRTFDFEPSLQEENKRNVSAPITRRSRQKGELIAVSDGKIVLNEDHHMSEANPESIANYKTSPIVEDVDIDVVPSPQPEESGNDSDFSDSLLLDISPAIAKFERRVTFNEDVEVIRQQLAMVSAPAPASTTNSDDESDYDNMDEDGKDVEDDEENENDEGTPGEGSDSHTSENGSEIGSSADEHSIEPSSPGLDHRPFNTTLPSTPIRRWASIESLDSSSGGEDETEMLDDEMILDNISSVVSERDELSDAVYLWENNYDEERPNWNLSCPWAPRRPALVRISIEVDGDVGASPSSRAPRKKPVNNIRLNESQMDWSSTQPATPIPCAKRYRREPSIELGNADWPPRSLYSQSIKDSQTSRVVEPDHQSKQFIVADVPSYFSAASHNFNRSLYMPTVPPMRSKSMPMRSRYFENEGQDCNADGNILSNLVSARKVESFMGSQDERNTSLKALTRHISFGFRTPGEKRRTPLLPFRPPLKHV